MKRLGIIAMMATVVAAGYKDGRISPMEDFPPYQGIRQHPPFHEQHQPFREPPFKVQQYQSYRQRPYRQDSSSYSEQVPVRDYPSKGRPFYADGPSFRDAPDMKNQPSFFADGPSFSSQSFSRDQPYFRSEIQDEPMSSQYSYRQGPFSNDFRFSDLYKEQDQPPQSFIRDSEYLKHGNHGLGYVSVPPVSPYENAFPLNEGTSTTAAPTTPALASEQKSSQQSSVSGNGPAVNQLHTSATSPPNMASHTATMPSVKFDTLADSTASTTTTPAISTAAAVSVTSKQSSNLAHPPTVASLPVVPTESPIISFTRHTMPPSEYQTTKFTVPGSYYVTSGMKNKLQQSLLNYFLSQQGKTTVKGGNDNSLGSYVPLQSAINSGPSKNHSPAFNYVLQDESKLPLKDNLQSSFLNYLLQQESNRDLPVQHSSLPETVNYMPLASTLSERQKLSLPGIPLATLSAVSRPLQSINYVPATMPRVSGYMGQDTASTSLPLGSSLDVFAAGTTLPSSLGTAIPESHPTSIFNSYPAGLNTGISAGIPASMSAALPASMPTLNLGQNFQHVGQLRQFGAASSQPLSYSTGLQLQLGGYGGYGGIDYALRSSNPAPRPLELGIAKVGLSLPELPRHQLPTFSKMSLEHPMW
nr:mucin-5AC-like [Megalopta genalis]